MKYQKSMLKIYELLLTKEFIIEDLIKKASVGRTSCFEAIMLNLFDLEAKHK